MDARHRPLTPGEARLLRPIFGAALGPELERDTRIVRGGGSHPIARIALDLGRGQAIALGRTIWFHPACYEDDFSVSTRGGQGLLAHEFTHLWQYRSGRTTPAGIALNSLALRGAGRDPYDISGVRPDMAFDDLGYEQQASLVGAIAQALREGRRPETIRHLAVIRSAGLSGLA